MTEFADNLDDNQPFTDYASGAEDAADGLDDAYDMAEGGSLVEDLDASYYDNGFEEEDTDTIPPEVKDGLVDTIAERVIEGDADTLCHPGYDDSGNPDPNRYALMRTIDYEPPAEQTDSSEAADLPRPAAARIYLTTNIDKTMPPESANMIATVSRPIPDTTARAVTHYSITRGQYGVDIERHENVHETKPRTPQDALAEDAVDMVEPGTPEYDQAMVDMVAEVTDEIERMYAGEATENDLGMNVATEAEVRDLITMVQEGRTLPLNTTDTSRDTFFDDIITGGGADDLRNLGGEYPGPEPNTRN